MTNNKYVFLFTDIESDGPCPGLYSMLSFASIAKSEDGETLGEFEANLKTLPNASQHRDTMQWWKSQPEAWQYSTKDPRDPAIVMQEYAVWVKSLGSTPVLAAHPISFDSMWITWYLAKFVDEKIFPGPGLDLVSYAHAVLGWNFFDCHRSNWPQEWLGEYKHSHKAIDDARGYSEAFFHMKKLAKLLIRDEKSPSLKENA